MKIYTKTGDKGQTSLLFGKRVPKDDLRVEAYGTVDEANSTIGLAVSFLPEEAAMVEVRGYLNEIQQVLFNVGAELATPAGRRPGWETTEAHVQTLEDAIDALEARMPPLTSFLLPGGSPSGAALHVARTVARRAERQSVTIAGQDELNPLVISYLNRLSDFLFVCARYVNQVMGQAEPAGPVPQGLKANAAKAAKQD